MSASVATALDLVAPVGESGNASPLSSTTWAVVPKLETAASMGRGSRQLLLFPEGGVGRAARPIFAELEALEVLEVGWNGYGAPSPSKLAVRNAAVVLEVAHARGLSPSSVVPSVDGGVAVCFRNRAGDYADIECFNDGDSWAIVAPRAGALAPKSWPVALENSDIVLALERIRAQVEL